MEVLACRFLGFEGWKKREYKLDLCSKALPGIHRLGLQGKIQRVTREGEQVWGDNRCPEGLGLNRKGKICNPAADGCIDSGPVQETVLIMGWSVPGLLELGETFRQVMKEPAQPDL